MARIRSIHPGLTSDEAYMSMSMVAKAAWTPLWMQCDDHGIFEWKPVVLKALIFPADNVNFTEVLAELEGLGCIRKIDIGGRPHGVVRNFAKYQRPKNPSYRHFKPEELPADIGSFIAIKGQAAPVLPQSSPSTTENPPQMKEEGGKREEEEEVKKESIPPVAKARPCAEPDFIELKKIYPKRLGDYKWALAERKFNALVKTGVDSKKILEAARRLEATHRKLGNIGTQFVPMPASWLNSEDFTEIAAMSFIEQPEELNWDAVLVAYKKTGHWSRFAGNDPSSPNCRCPPEILAKHGLLTQSETVQ
jgi:hypothetical protein